MMVIIMIKLKFAHLSIPIANNDFDRASFVCLQAAICAHNFVLIFSPIQTGHNNTLSIDKYTQTDSFKQF